ncbi:MAG: RidA family protein [Bacteroidetes bacterium]|uniref:RidA family protein n=1 Tax=Candidatus Merdivivens pullicola TaxID=2840872 RepID=A0A9D9NG81_9BACT|nr:RidA family protein [Candidatus Merdivivens pullicola]
MKKVISSPKAPAAVGPYSQAIEINGMLFVSGQLPTNPATGKAPETIEEQTRQSLANAAAILEEAGYTFADVVKTTVLLADIKDFAAMNAVYAEHFSGAYPARVCYQVAALPMGAKVEIDMIAGK